MEIPTAMPATRRTFLKSLAAVTALPACGRASPASETKLTLSAPLTHSDWMLKANGPKWGPEGVRHMLDACKACGWSNVYWRVFDAGVSTYRSKLLRPGCKAEVDSFFQPQNEADLAARQSARGADRRSCPGDCPYAGLLRLGGHPENIE